MDSEIDALENRAGIGHSRSEKIQSEKHRDNLNFEAHDRSFRKKPGFGLSKRA
jgi:hypothetical protein